MYVACSERETSFWYQLFKSTPDGDKVIVVGATARVTKSQLKSVSLFIVVYVICCRTHRFTVYVICCRTHRIIVYVICCRTHRITVYVICFWMSRMRRRKKSWMWTKKNPTFWMAEQACNTQVSRCSDTLQTWKGKLFNKTSTKSKPLTAPDSIQRGL